MPFTSAEAIAGKILPQVLACWQGEEDFQSRRVPCLAACPTRAPAGAAIAGQKRRASSVLGRRYRLCGTEGKDEDSVAPHADRREEPGLATLTRARASPLIPCSLRAREARTRPCWNRLLLLARGRGTDRTAESLGWDVIRSVLPRRVLASLHPCSTLPAWQRRIKAPKVSLQSPSSVSVCLVLLR